MSTILIAGGTGLIGRSLTQMLTTAGHQVIIMTRSSELKSVPGGLVRYAAWDVKRQEIDRDAIREADVIIHLAGAGIAEKRWTKKRKQVILESRTQAAGLIVKALQEIPNKVSTVISGSAIGWYKPALPAEGSHQRIETDPADPGFLGRTCRLWEQSIEPVTALGKRLVILRTGIVLSNEGGVLPEFSKPLRFGIAAILGTGKQFLSWIHIDDLCRLYRQAIENEDWQGVYNAVTPVPVTNKSLTLELARQMKGRFFIPFYVPAFLLKWIFGEVSTEVLKSTLVSADKIKKTGFQFLYPSVESALGNLIKKNRAG